MADTEVKGRGRPKKVDAAPPADAKKRPAAAASDATPAKRGRGRPPKGAKKPKKVYKKKANSGGRGRPPKNAPKKDAKKSSGDDESA